MPPKKPTLYSLYKTTIWFSIASILLLAGLVVMVIKDGSRDWKHWQSEYMHYSRELAETELKAAEKALNHKELDAAKEELALAAEKIKTHADQIKAIEAELIPIEFDSTTTNALYQTLKQEQDSERYFFEEAEHNHEDEKAAAHAKSLEARAIKLREAQLRIEELAKKREDVNVRLDEFKGRQKEMTLEIRRLTSDITRIESKIKKLTPNWAQSILNAPMLDFIRPNLQIQQIVLEDLHDDYFFAQVNKVDRCITCHLGIDQASFKDAPGPFKAHPKLDLFVGADSPHPAEEFGCTSCHGGGGHSVSFTTAAHTPQNEEQAAKWKKEYHWKDMTHWGDKMLPMNYVEASCAKCHTGTLDVPMAPKLNEGRQLAQTFGCFGCHKVEGFENRWKSGPSLTHIQSKVEPDWIVRWLQNPKEFRPTTTMPRIFHLENTDDPESKDKSNAAIAGIAAYLMKNSDPVSLNAPPLKGNPEVGGELVKSIGCMGCHGVAGVQVSVQGPMLSGLGSKVSADWLYTWLKNPQHYMEDTRMPNLRLSDEEAANITAYLLLDKNDKFESIRPPLVKPEVVDGLVLHHLKTKMRQEEAVAKLESMGVEERLEFIGEKSIQHQGCTGCHSIKGFETANRVGTELTKEGVKDVHRFDFGFVDIDHTRRAWITQKLKEPRSFDRGKDKTYYEKLRMPQFDFNDDQAEKLTTYILSLTGTEIPLSKKRLLSQSEEETEVGRLIVEKYNCQGCHTLDGVDAKVRELFEDLGDAPPILDGEGKKVQPLWLYHFLENPTPIRPWLKYRMPTFPFNEHELTTVVQYFNHLSEVLQTFADTTKVVSTEEELAHGKQLFESFQCIKCHKSNPEPGLSASFLAPNLVMSKDRLRPDWVRDWLRDPQAIQEGTMMPGFFPDGESPVQDIFEGNAEKQIEAIRDYIWQFQGEGASTPEKTKGAQS